MKFRLLIPLFFLCSLGLSAYPIQIVNLDVEGRPVVLKNEKSYYQCDAESLLLMHIVSEDVLTKLIREVETTQSTDSAILLSAVADRILPATQANRIRTLILKTFLGDIPSRHNLSFREKITIESKLKNYPVILRHYLYWFALRNEIYLPISILDVSLPASLSLAISAQSHPATGACFANIRESGTNEEKFIAELFLWLSAQYMDNEKRSQFLRYYDVDLGRMRECSKTFSRDAWFVKMYRCVDYLMRNNQTEEEKRFSDEGEETDYDFYALKEDLSALTKEHCLSVINAATDCFRWECEQGGQFNSQTMELSAYAAYLSIKALSENVLGYFSNFSTFGKIQGMQGNRREVATLLSYLKERARQESSPKKRKFFNSVFSDILQQAYPQNTEMLKQEFPLEWRKGEEMAKNGVYENEDFEKRFQDSLRERAKQLEGNKP